MRVVPVEKALDSVLRSMFLDIVEHPFIFIIYRPLAISKLNEILAPSSYPLGIFFFTSIEVRNAHKFMVEEVSNHLNFHTSKAQNWEDNPLYYVGCWLLRSLCTMVLSCRLSKSWVKARFSNLWIQTREFCCEVFVTIMFGQLLKLSTKKMQSNVLWRVDNAWQWRAENVKSTVPNFWKGCRWILNSHCMNYEHSKPIPTKKISLGWSEDSFR